VIANGGQLHQHLRIVNPIANVTGKMTVAANQNRISIEQRPEIVEQKARIGDWEGDTVIGKGIKEPC